MPYITPAVHETRTKSIRIGLADDRNRFSLTSNLLDNLNSQPQGLIATSLATSEVIDRHKSWCTKGEGVENSAFPLCRRTFYFVFGDVPLTSPSRPPTRLVHDAAIRKNRQLSESSLSEPTSPTIVDLRKLPFLATKAREQEARYATAKPHRGRRRFVAVMTAR